MVTDFIRVTGILAVSILVLQGCSGGRMITIDSEPQGASILADGKNIGQTPMEIETDEVFPPRWVGTTYIVKGKLAIQKEGCEKFTMDVNDNNLSKDINASLTCTNAAMSSGTEKAGSMKPVVIEESVEQRLQELKNLYDKGVITEKEYSEQRKRILDKI